MVRRLCNGFLDASHKQARAYIGSSPSISSGCAISTIPSDTPSFINFWLPGWIAVLRPPPCRTNS